MGCSRLFFQSILIVLAIVGLNSLGLLVPVKDAVITVVQPKPQLVKQSAQKIADFSKVPPNYKFQASYKVLGAEAVVTENTKDGSYIAMGNTGPLLQLSKNDLKSDEINKKIAYLAPVLINSPAKISNFAITDKSTFHALNQDIPYAKIKVVSQTNPNISYEGIIAVYDTKDNKTQTIVAFNEAGRYHQVSTEEFFKKIRLN